MSKSDVDYSAIKTELTGMKSQATQNIVAPFMESQYFCDLEQGWGKAISTKTKRLHDGILARIVAYRDTQERDIQMLLGKLNFREAFAKMASIHRLLQDRPRAMCTEATEDYMASMQRNLENNLLTHVVEAIESQAGSDVATHLQRCYDERVKTLSRDIQTLTDDDQFVQLVALSKQPLGDALIQTVKMRVDAKAREVLTNFDRALATQPTDEVEALYRDEKYTPLRGKMDVKIKKCRDEVALAKAKLATAMSTANFAGAETTLVAIFLRLTTKEQEALRQRLETCKTQFIERMQQLLERNQLATVAEAALAQTGAMAQTLEQHYALQVAAIKAQVTDYLLERNIAGLIELAEYPLGKTLCTTVQHSITQLTTAILDGIAVMLATSAASDVEADYEDAKFDPIRPQITVMIEAAKEEVTAAKSRITTAILSDDLRQAKMVLDALRARLTPEEQRSFDSQVTVAFAKAEAAYQSTVSSKDYKAAHAILISARFLEPQASLCLTGLDILVTRQIRTFLGRLEMSLEPQTYITTLNSIHKTIPAHRLPDALKMFSKRLITVVDILLNADGGINFIILEQFAKLPLLEADIAHQIEQKTTTKRTEIKEKVLDACTKQPYDLALTAGTLARHTFTETDTGDIAILEAHLIKAQASVHAQVIACFPDYVKATSVLVVNKADANTNQKAKAAIAEAEQTRKEQIYATLIALKQDEATQLLAATAFIDPKASTTLSYYSSFITKIKAMIEEGDYAGVEKLLETEADVDTNMIEALQAYLKTQKVLFIDRIQELLVQARFSEAIQCIDSAKHNNGERTELETSVKESEADFVEDVHSQLVAVIPDTLKLEQARETQKAVVKIGDKYVRSTETITFSDESVRTSLNVVITTCYTILTLLESGNLEEAEASLKHLHKVESLYQAMHKCIRSITEVHATQLQELTDEGQFEHALAYVEQLRFAQTSPIEQRVARLIISYMTKLTSTDKLLSASTVLVTLKSKFHSPNSICFEALARCDDLMTTLKDTKTACFKSLLLPSHTIELVDFLLNEENFVCHQAREEATQQAFDAIYKTLMETHQYSLALIMLEKLMPGRNEPDIGVIIDLQTELLKKHSDSILAAQDLSGEDDFALVEVMADEEIESTAAVKHESRDAADQARAALSAMSIAWTVLEPELLRTIVRLDAHHGCDLQRQLDTCGLFEASHLGHLRKLITENNFMAAVNFIEGMQPLHAELLTAWTLYHQEIVMEALTEDCEFEVIDATAEADSVQSRLPTKAVKTWQSGHFYSGPHLTENHAKLHTALCQKLGSPQGKKAQPAVNPARAGCALMPAQQPRLPSDASASVSQHTTNLNAC